MAKDDRAPAPANHLPSDPTVTEGGRAPLPGDGAGNMKGSASKAEAEGRPTSDTSTATQGKAEKEHAAAVSSAKPRSQRAQDD